MLPFIHDASAVAAGPFPRPSQPPPHARPRLSSPNDEQPAAAPAARHEPMKNLLENSLFNFLLFAICEQSFQSPITWMVLPFTISSRVKIFSSQDFDMSSSKTAIQPSVRPSVSR